MLPVRLGRYIWCQQAAGVTTLVQRPAATGRTARHAHKAAATARRCSGKPTASPPTLLASCMAPRASLAALLPRVGAMSRLPHSCSRGRAPEEASTPRHSARASVASLQRRRRQGRAGQGSGWHQRLRRLHRQWQRSSGRKEECGMHCMPGGQGRAMSRRTCWAAAAGRIFHSMHELHACIDRPAAALAHLTRWGVAAGRCSTTSGRGARPLGASCGAACSTRTVRLPRLARR